MGGQYADFIGDIEVSGDGSTLYVTGFTAVAGLYNCVGRLDLSPEPGWEFLPPSGLGYRFDLAVVPEPATAGLLAVGLALLAVRARSRRREGD